MHPALDRKAGAKWVGDATLRLVADYACQVLGYGQDEAPVDRIERCTSSGSAKRNRHAVYRVTVAADIPPWWCGFH